MQSSWQSASWVTLLCLFLCAPAFSAEVVASPWGEHLEAGSAALDKADYARAIAEFKKSLELIPAKGPGLSDRALAAEGLGVAHCRLGRYAQAEVEFRYSLAVRREMSEPETSRLAVAFTNLGTICYYTGRLDEARHYHLEAMRINERLYGPGSAIVANDLNNLATIYITQGRFAQAEQLLRRAIDIFQSRGRFDRRLPVFMRNLADVFSQLHRYKEAQALQEETLDLEREVEGRSHPDVGITLSQMAISEVALKRCEAADRDVQEAIVILRSTFGEQHPHTAQAYFASGLANECLRQFDLAERALRHAVEIEEHQEYLAQNRAGLLKAYARVLRHSHKNAEAKQYETMAANGSPDSVRRRRVVDVKELEQ